MLCVDPQQCFPVVFPRRCGSLFTPLHLSTAALQTVVPALRGVCVCVFMCFGDKAAQARWSCCAVLGEQQDKPRHERAANVSAQTTTYGLRRGSLRDCRRRCSILSDAKPLSPDSRLLLHSIFFFFRNILIQTGKQI